MSPRIQTSPETHRPAETAKLGFNADAAAIGIALALATLIRLNVIHHIGW